MRSSRMAALAAVFYVCQAFPAHALEPARTGIASWYGWRENGRLMANGHRFHALGATAASWRFPFGTRVKVTNLRTRRSAWVTIEDRGPGISGRMIDLSLGTARLLGMERKGLDRVLIRPVSYDHRAVRGHRLSHGHHHRIGSRRR